jgi:hypothetical protein
MGREINFDSIRVLEEQIREHERTLIQLKRARNSLLNVSTLLPPEILGRIFRWNVIPDGDWGGLPKDSHNFLLVCHHWFQVASDTPELWGFWGNSIEDWARRHTRWRTAPLDLVLGKHTYCDLDDTIRDTLRDRATRDTIRRVHLWGDNASGLLNPIISSIVAEGEGTRSNSVESFILQNKSAQDVDISNFFSRHHFPKLQRLDLQGCSISSWDLMKSRTTSLTALGLAGIRGTPLPTLSQTLSILSPNPNLRRLVLSFGSVPDVNSDGPSSRIQLHHLKQLHSTSEFRCVFGLLDRLDLPNKMDDLSLSLYECSPSDLLQTLGPYLGNHIRHRSPDRLRLLAAPTTTSFNIRVGDARKDDPTWGDWFVTMGGFKDVIMGEEEADKLWFDIIAHIPLERVVYLETALPILRSEEICVRMRNLTHLDLEGVDLSTWFIGPDTREPHVFNDLLRGLRSVSISRYRLSGGDWSPLTSFLTRRAAVGNRISSLNLGHYIYMGEDVVESIRRAVDVFEDGRSPVGSDHQQTMESTVINWRPVEDI